ncbi:adenine deaminase [Companilactobacillus sp. DQM5]|uniref:adenine deaminase n=1 Tax=Companilactobacillus sp. DQM5 TaxID=3463359 RepID=UPI0040584040
MKKEELKNLINKANKKELADIVFQNVKIVDVYNGQIIESSLAISNGKILGFGNYKGKKVIDGQGQFIVPGLIDPHIHIESANVTPEVFGQLATPHGTTTILADPHEIVNVAGMRGLDYMIESAKNTMLDIKYTMPSCVPAASSKLETSGAVITAKEIKESYEENMTYGLAEFMNYDGVINAEDNVLDELLVSINNNKQIDGHSPSLLDENLNAYIAAGIKNDHECTRVDEMLQRISRGMYVYLRYGTVSKNMPDLLKGVTLRNSRFCCFCGDDIQSVTLKENGHLDESIRVAVKEGLDSITAIQMATINTAQCCGLKDRGAIAPGLKADFILVDNLKDFNVNKTYIDGILVAQKGEYLLEVKNEMHGFSDLLETVHLDKFNSQQLKMNITSEKANVIGLKDTSRTLHLTEVIKHTKDNDFDYEESKDVIKAAVIERHHKTGNVGLGLLKGFGIKDGAIATSIGHDSHNIVVVGTNNKDMEFAVNELIRIQGGAVAVKKRKKLAEISFKLGGLISVESVNELIKNQRKFNQICHEELFVNKKFDPIMKLGALPLDVIPKLRLTDKGIVDVTRFKIIEINA